MAILRENDSKKEYIKSKLKAIYSELLDCNEQYATNYVDWILTKLLHNKNHLREIKLNREIKKLRSKTDEESKRALAELLEKRRRILPKNYPSSLEKGDIIHVNYGIGLGDELTDGHYGIILNRRGLLFLVAPLTSTPQPYGDLNIDLKNLSLPGESPNGSYVSFNHLKYVHYRRIENIIGIPEGKRRINREIVDKIFFNFFNLNK